MNDPEMSGTGSHNEFTVVYDKESGQIAHVHLFASHDGSSLSPEVKDSLARETAGHRLARVKSARTLEDMATLHVAGNALVRGHAYHVDVNTRTIVQRAPAK
jgi:hypothetical protein